MKLGENQFMLKNQVNNSEIALTEELIAIHLGIPASGFRKYGKGSCPVVFQFDHLTISKKFSHNDALTEGTSFHINAMSDEDRLLFSLMVRGILPHGSKTNEANGLDLTVMEHICRNEEVNLPLLMSITWYMSRTIGDIRYPMEFGCPRF